MSTRVEPALANQYQQLSNLLKEHQTWNQRVSELKPYAEKLGFSEEEESCFDKIQQIRESIFSRLRSFFLGDMLEGNKPLNISFSLPDCRQFELLNQFEININDSLFFLIIQYEIIARKVRETIPGISNEAFCRSYM